MSNLIADIEKTFSHLEAYWGVEVPDALEHKGWDAFALLAWVEEARGIPNVHYKRLLDYLQQGDLQAEYAERLEKLNRLIKDHKPDFLRLLDASD